MSDAERFERIREVFLDARAKDGAERAAYLAEVCAGDD